MLCPCPQARRSIFRLALDIAQVPALQVIYIENTPMFVQIAEGLGIRSILHTDYRSRCAQLASFGLHDDKRGIHEGTKPEALFLKKGIES